MTSVVTEWQWSYDGWILIVTALVAAVCAIPGTFLLIRRQAMLGDGIAHAVLPGIAVGFLISGDRGGGWMLVGAIAAGLTTSMLTQLLRGVAGVDRGAALGVVFLSLFALGLLLIAQAADSVDLDPGCVLYGQLELAPLDRMEVMGVEVPRAVPSLVIVFLSMVFMTMLLWKELLVASFDSATANAQGLPARPVNQILMILVAVACVVAFEAVGSILVVSFLVAPPAVARFFFHRLSSLLPAAVAAGCLISAVGQLIALSIPATVGAASTGLSIAGTTSVVGVVAVVCAAAIRYLASCMSGNARGLAANASPVEL